MNIVIDSGYFALITGGNTVYYNTGTWDIDLVGDKIYVRNGYGRCYKLIDSLTQVGTITVSGVITAKPLTMSGLLDLLLLAYAGSSLIAKMYTFDGVDERVIIPHAAAYDVIDHNANFSIEAWMQYTEVGASENILSKYRATEVVNGKGWVLYKQNTNILIMFFADKNNNKTQFKTTDTYNINTWYHVIFENSGHDFYINGVLANMAADSIGAVTTAKNTHRLMWLSRDDSASIPYDAGKIALVRIWNKNLVLAEIQQLYNGGDPVNATKPAGCVYEWNGNNDVWGGVNYSVIDEINANNGATENMEQGDLTDKS